MKNCLMCGQEVSEQALCYRQTCNVCFQKYHTSFIDSVVIGKRGLMRLANATRQDKTGLERMRTPSQILQDTPFMTREFGIRTV